uniref:C2H2-type domain-containing protein n=1 Tax=Myripristis murdjan TaxID=586833 RepID=A0A667ZMM1_9TELE
MARNTNKMELKPALQLLQLKELPAVVIKEEVPPEQQEWTPSLDQEEPEPPHIKEEQEELWTNQEAEQLQDLTKFPFTAVPVKSEDDEEEAQCSQLHGEQDQMKTEADGEEAAADDGDDRTSDSSEAQTEDSEDWEETREPQSGSNTPNQIHPSQNTCDVGEKPSSCSVSKRTGEKLWSCSVCGTNFQRKGNLNRHMMMHKGEKPFSCSVCGKHFTWKNDLNTHMRTHTGEKPFSCLVCGKSFMEKKTLQHSHKNPHRRKNI